MRSNKRHKKFIKDLSSDFYSLVIDSLQDYSIFTLDKDLLITSWSSGSKNIFGYETEEIIGKHIDLIFTEEDKSNEVSKNEAEETRRSGSASGNRWHICKNGAKIYALGKMFPLLDNDGLFMGYVKILKDLTEKWSWEEERKRYVKGLEELIVHKEGILSVISHDLRNPLSGIYSITEYLEADFDTIDRSELKEMLGVLHKSSGEELDMLDYLVNWASVKFSSDIFTPKHLMLSQSVIKAFTTLNETAAKDSITLYSEVDDSTIVFADEKMLLSILMNLISNAIKHSHNGEQVTVMAKSDNNNVIVQIEDTGTGMSKQVLDKLFTPQLKSHADTDEKKKGAGIGLLLVKGFLDVQGGKVWVESAEGQGSSFYFTLPANELIDQTTINSADIPEI